MFGIGLIKGLSVTLKHFFEKPITVQYPESRLPVGPLFRGGAIRLNVAKCISCGLCSMACPNNAIDLTTEKTEDGKKKLSHYVHNIPVCMYCNYCIEACPTKAITWTADYEMSCLDRNALRIDCLATGLQVQAAAAPTVAEGGQS